MEATKQYDLGETFNMPGAKGIKMEGREDTGNPMVPRLIEGYVHKRETLSDLTSFLKIGAETGDGLLLVGPTGSGKTSAITQVFGGLNIPLQRAVGHPMMEFSDLSGHFTVIDGDMTFVDGPLTTAMRLGHPFLLDELDQLRPGVATGLHAVIEEGVLSIPENGGEVVVAQPGFMVIGTANTAGSGDRTGLYQGTLRQNAALMDRFWVVEIDYTDREIENEILLKVVPNLPDYIREGILDVAQEVRALFKGESEGPQIELPMSTRTVVRWARLSERFQSAAKQGKHPVKHALDRAFANRAEPETKLAIHGIVDRVIGDIHNVGGA